MATTFDFTPLLRSTIGFDHLSRMLDSALHVDEGSSAYPPYNIEKGGEDHYRITMAIAGFRPDDLEVTAEANSLTVKGKRYDDEAVKYLHRGIAARAFERRFQLADHVNVVAANLENGLLQVDLVRELPERLKPRTIGIRSNAKPQAVAHAEPEAA